MKHLKQFDPEIAEAIAAEVKRQQENLELIASENIVSSAILEALGSPLTNKYSEGYPGKRYYGGNQHIDTAENLARDRAKELFGAEHANVQAHAGSPANMAAYMAMTKPGNKILAMSLNDGGHLTHGSKVNFSGKLYDFASYGVRQKDEMIDMDEVRKIALREKPKIIVAGFSAYSRHLCFVTFQKIAEEVGAYLMTDMAHFAGLVAAKLHPDPIPYSDVVTTTTHKTLRGPRGAMILCKKEDRLRPDSKKNLAERIDSAVFPGMQGGPLDHAIAAKAVAFKEAATPEFVEYQKQVLKNAVALSEALQEEDIRIVSGGTDNHLMLVDLTSLDIAGKEAEDRLDSVGICVNKNMIPFDKRKPSDPSGVRLGTPALTTRGFTELEMKEIAGLIVQTLRSSNESTLKKVRDKVLEMTGKHPIYADWPCC